MGNNQVHFRIHMYIVGLGAFSGNRDLQPLEISPFFSIGSMNLFTMLALWLFRVPTIWGTSNCLDIIEYD